MPIHEFDCQSCDARYEALVRHDNSESEITCPVCGSTDHTMLFSSFSTKNSVIHTSERTVILENPRTGETRSIPHRDTPIHPNYVAQGFVKKEAFTTHQERAAFEKRTGKLVERAHYDPGSNTLEAECTDFDGPSKSAMAKFKLSKKTITL